MSDYYIEQADNGFVFEGDTGLPPGRITLQGGKLHFNTPRDKPREGTAMTINRYRGQVIFGPNQFYTNPPNVCIANTGNVGTELTIVASLFYKTLLDLVGDKTLKLHLIGNEGVDHVTAEGEATFHDSNAEDTDSAAQQLTAALDHLRELGEWDLRLNHP
jgi:hypothetical protein